MLQSPLVPRLGKPPTSNSLQQRSTTCSPLLLLNLTHKKGNNLAIGTQIKKTSTFWLLFRGFNVPGLVFPIVRKKIRMREIWESEISPTILYPVCKMEMNWK